MKQNEGTADRVIRVIISSMALLAAYFWLGGTAQIITYVVGVIGLVTGLVGFCGLYTIFGVSTCQVKKSNPSKKVTSLLLFLTITIFALGSFASLTITRKKFLENFNGMNNYYKQTLTRTP